MSYKNVCELSIMHNSYVIIHVVTMLSRFRLQNYKVEQAANRILQMYTKLKNIIINIKYINNVIK